MRISAIHQPPINPPPSPSMHSALSSVQKIVHRNTSEITIPETVGRANEPVVLNELSAQVSYGLRQRFIASYNPDTADFDVSVYLAYPAHPFPSRDIQGKLSLTHAQTHAMKYLAHAKAGMINPQNLIRWLPYIDESSFQKGLLSAKQMGGKPVYQFAKEFPVINIALGRDPKLQFTPEALQQFYREYGGLNGSLVRLVGNLQRAGIKEESILTLAKLLHGQLRVNTLIAFSNLHSTVKTDPKSWGKSVVSFCKPFAITEGETKLILDARKVMGLQVPDVPVSKPVTVQTPMKDKKSPQAEKSKIQLGAVGATDKGPVREINEDNYYVSADGNIIVIADGMGGHAKGEEASKMVVDAFRNRPAGEGLDVTIQNAHRSIYSKGHETEYHGMGTTCVVAEIIDGRAKIANIGDSRAYLIRGHSIRQLTRDHSWVQEQVDAGLLTPEQAAAHKERNVITRALGVLDEARPDIFTQELQQGDVLVLVTDGVTNAVSDQGILSAVRSSGSADGAAKAIVQAALSGRTTDNATAVVWKGA